MNFICKEMCFTLMINFNGKKQIFLKIYIYGNISIKKTQWDTYILIYVMYMRKVEPTLITNFHVDF